MTWTTNLDFICPRTTCWKTASIQHSLFCWCLTCLKTLKASMPQLTWPCRRKVLLLDSIGWGHLANEFDDSEAEKSCLFSETHSWVEHQTSWFWQQGCVEEPSRSQLVTYNIQCFGTEPESKAARDRTSYNPSTSYNLRFHPSKVLVNVFSTVAAWNFTSCKSESYPIYVLWWPQKISINITGF